MTIDAIFNDILDCRIPLHIRPSGLSMHPFIRRGDYITITPLDPEAGIAVGDCVIFRGQDERWLIHRVIGYDRGSDKIITKGDSLLRADRPVERRVVWGRVSALERAGSGRRIPLDKPSARRLCRLIALLSRGEARVSFFAAAPKPEGKEGYRQPFSGKIIKLPKWLLTRAFFP